MNIAIAQRLLRKICPYCKKKVEASSEAAKVIEKELAKMSAESLKELNVEVDPLFVYEPVGCKRCNNVGYSGRIGIYEVLEMTDELSELVLKEHSELAIEAEAKRQGMITMKQDGIGKVLTGITSLEEVISTAEEK